MGCFITNTKYRGQLVDLMVVPRSKTRPTLSHSAGTWGARNTMEKLKDRFL